MGFLKQFLGTITDKKDTALSSIPTDVRDLLWLLNGPCKNCDDPGEPSAIDTSLPIGQVLPYPEKLNYYPSYSNLDLNERATYLHWLENIETPIDIGYVFIFYYGVERFLVTRPEKFAQAYNMIIRLCKYHKNSSLQVYAEDAIIFSCLLYQQYDFFDLYTSEIAPALSSAGLLYKSFHNYGLAADEIIELASSVHFSNRRYIKNHPIQFKATLQSLLFEKYQQGTYPLSRDLMQTAPRIEIHLANYAIINSALNTGIPNLLEHPKIQHDLFNLLSDTHNIVKSIPIKQRL